MICRPKPDWQTVRPDLVMTGWPHKVDLTHPTVVKSRVGTYRLIIIIITIIIIIIIISLIKRKNYRIKLFLCALQRRKYCYIKKKIV